MIILFICCISIISDVLCIRTVFFIQEICCCLITSLFWPLYGQIDFLEKLSCFLKLFILSTWFLSGESSARLIIPSVSWLVWSIGRLTFGRFYTWTIDVWTLRICFPTSIHFKFTLLYSYPLNFVLSTFITFKNFKYNFS